VSTTANNEHTSICLANKPSSTIFAALRSPQAKQSMAPDRYSMMVK